MGRDQPFPRLPRLDLAPGGFCDLDACGTAQQAQPASGRYARGRVFNACLYRGHARSLIENTVGGAAADTLPGNAAGNGLWGGDGTDSGTGDDGADSLFGGTGTDRMAGGADNDTFFGGLGADPFMIEDGTGVELLRDFDRTVDRVDVSALGLSGFSDFAVSYTPAQASFVAGGITINVLGLTQAETGADMFIP
jgi:Ca2+-binding RTX toxin-like protein